MKSNHLLHRFFTIFVVSSMLLWSGYVGAAVVVFNNNIGYTAAVGAELFLVDFNSAPTGTVNGGSIDPNVIFSSPEAGSPANVLRSSNALTDAGSTTAANNVGPIALDFVSTGVFGFSFLSSSSGQLQTIELYDNSNSLIASVLSPGSGGFFGFVSDTAIGSAKVVPGAYGPNLYDRFFIDDLRANVAVVPEPATFMLLGLGLVVLGFMNRKNKQA